MIAAGAEQTRRDRGIAPRFSGRFGARKNRDVVALPLLPSRVRCNSLSILAAGGGKGRLVRPCSRRHFGREGISSEVEHRSSGDATTRRSATLLPAGKFLAGNDVQPRDRSRERS